MAGYDARFIRQRCQVHETLAHCRKIAAGKIRPTDTARKQGIPRKQRIAAEKGNLVCGGGCGSQKTVCACRSLSRGLGRCLYGNNIPIGKGIRFGIAVICLYASVKVRAGPEDIERNLSLPASLFICKQKEL